MRPPHIAVIGNIAAGKSTTVPRLARALGLPALVEDFRPNPFLESFYADPAQWAYRSQTWFAVEAISRRAELVRSGAGGVQEQMPESVVHVMTRALHDAGFLSANELSTLVWLVDSVAPLMPGPDIVVRLRAPVPELLKRIPARGRSFESGIDAAYLRHIENALDEFVQRLPSAVLDVETDALDVRRPADLATLAGRVRAALER